MKKQKQDQEVKGFLGWVERVGNAMPHPAMIFVILTVVLLIVAEIMARKGISVDFYDARAKEETTLTAVSLLNPEGIRYMFNSAVKNFTGFAPLGTVLVAMLGVGVAEHTGLFEVSLRKMLSKVNPKVLTITIILAGIMSNIASDAGYVVVIPLGAMMFAAAGRHPVAGLAAAFAGVSAGFSANLAIGTLDPLLTGITNEALKITNIDMTIDPTSNYFFMFASTFLLTFVGYLVTEYIVEPNLGQYTGDYVHEHSEITEAERKGLRNAGIALLIYVIVMGILMFSPWAIFPEADADGNVNLKAFLGDGLMVGILLLFMIPGLVFGKTTGRIKDSKDFVATMTKGMQGMGGYLVLAFFASQFVAFFGKTNIGSIISVNGAEFLQARNFTGIPLILIFILLSAFLNLFMGSASAKWAIMAPVFVPMMYELGINPALTQVAYRIGDSTTNIITPLMSYFAMIVVFMQKYEKDKGLGTLISTMIPYSMAFLVAWSVMMIIWMTLGLPLGPGTPLSI